MSIALQNIVSMFTFSLSSFKSILAIYRNKKKKKEQASVLTFSHKKKKQKKKGLGVYINATEHMSDWAIFDMDYIHAVSSRYGVSRVARLAHLEWKIRIVWFNILLPPQTQTPTPK